MILADCLADSPSEDPWAQTRSKLHGILLRRLGKKRVIYLVRLLKGSNGNEPSWQSNSNMVTGVDMDWLDESFAPGKLGNDYIIVGKT